MTQPDAILQALQAGVKLTPADALRDYGCMRLAARIYDLRQDGYTIMERPVTVKTRSGEATVSEYSMLVHQGELFETARRWDE